MSNLQFGNRPNYINVPMFRKGIEDRLAKGQKIYQITCVDLNDTSRNVVFQLITPKSLSKLDTQIKSLQQNLFYDKYLYSSDNLYAFTDEVKDIDEVDTSILFTVK